jgi:anti-sigma factor RsiW
MNSEFELKLQAWLDGELAPAEARQVEARVGQDPQAQALLGELRMTRTALRGNEPDYVLPEAREFFWSKIERAIAAGERQAQPANRISFGWLFRYWPQLSGATVAAALLCMAGFHFHWLSQQGWEDIENPLAETGTFCFRSEPDRMTLVWVYDRTEEKEEVSETLN